MDRDRRPGRFLLTGSADVASWSELASALVGRMEAVLLWPLSEAEMEAYLDELETFLEEGGVEPEAPGGEPPAACEVLDEIFDDCGG